MYTEMNCGHCESFFQIESDAEDAVWLLIHRYLDAHVECGFVARTKDEAPASFKKKIIKPRISDETEEA